MRTIWKGAISFGLVHIPVKLYPATKRNDIKFNFLHEKCKTPIKYKRFCNTCDTEVENEEIIKGYEYEGGKYVIVTDHELKNIPVDSNKAVNLLDFVNLSDVDPINFDKTYYLVPGDGGQKPYELLKQSLQRTGKVGIAKVVIRSKETLAAIRVYENVIAMETMFYHDEVRPISALTELNYNVSLHENELKMADSLINSLSAEFETEKYDNDYVNALMDIIQGKISGKDIEIPAIKSEDKVVDLMEALQASIKLAKEEKKKNESPQEKPKAKRKTS